MSSVMAQIFRDLDAGQGGPWAAAAEAEDSFAGFFWNEAGKRMTHLLPSIDSFDAGEEATTICGAVTDKASNTADFRFCAACLAGGL